MIDKIKIRIFQIFREHSMPRWLVLLIDMAAVYFSFLIAYMLRYNFEIYTFNISTAFHQAYFVLVVYTLFMVVFKSYSGMIRHTTIKDTYRLIFTNFSAVVVLFFITLMSRKNEWNVIFNVPLSILLIHSGAVTVFLLFFRVFIRMFYEFATSASHDRKNALIYGSGDLGVLVKRVIESDPKRQYRLKGFIDDDKKLQGKKVDGYSVFSRDILKNGFINREEIKVFIIAINKIAPSKKKEVLESMIEFGCEILDTPSLETWLKGKLEVNSLKKVKLEDLLARDPIVLDLEKIEEGLKNKTILVTGAAGSIGSEIARQLTRFQTRQLILLDQAETPSFYLEEELKKKTVACNFKVIIGDVTRQETMEYVFKKYKPEVIFHAAAYKHVPIMEAHPHEAFRVNVGGTRIVTELAIKHGVEKFVMVSTDKAVNPANVMGATKKICELLVHAQSQRENIRTQFITTRFGNVLGSNGSVVPLFNKQIAEGGPVTVTHPEITRFFMTIPEACQLVLEAGFMGNGGQIYVFNMGEPIRVLDVAINLIRLSGLEPYKDINIKFIGLRPGEKLFEELFSEDEPLLPTHHPKITIAHVQDGDYQMVLGKIDKLLASIYELSETKLIEDIKELVPEYKLKLEFIDR